MPKLRLLTHKNVLILRYIAHIFLNINIVSKGMCTSYLECGILHNIMISEPSHLILKIILETKRWAVI